jgi:hypothetical protein
MCRLAVTDLCDRGPGLGIKLSASGILYPSIELHISQRKDSNLRYY